MLIEEYGVCVLFAGLDRCHAGQRLWDWDAGGTAPAASSAACLVCLLTVLVNAGVVICRSLVLISLGMSAPPQSLAILTYVRAPAMAVRLPNRGWSRPVFSVHAELAVSEQGAS
jgi:hypothetical protein